MMNVPAIAGHGVHVGCIVCEANDMQRHKAQRGRVVFAGADVSVREHLGDFINDPDRPFLRGPSQIEDDAARCRDGLAQQMYHIRLLHHLDDNELVMERQVARHKRLAYIARGLVPPLHHATAGR